MQRSITLEIAKVPRDRHLVWIEEANRVRMIANRFLTEWELHHERNGSRDKIAEWLNQVRDWHRSPKDARGTKPKCPVNFDDSALAKQLYEAAKQIGQKVNSRVVVLLTNWLRRTLTTSSEGLPTWMQALLHRTRLQRFTKPLPIPADGKNASLEIREVEVKGKTVRQLWLKLRIDRIEGDGRRAESTLDEVQLIAGGKVAKYAHPIWRLAETKAPLKGIRLKWVEHKRKWFVVFSVEREAEEKPDLDAEKMAIVYASVRRPLLMRFDGRTRPITGAGEHVAQRRRQLQTQRRSRQSNYRISATRNTKGHGRKRALEPWEGKFARAWRNFQKLTNSEWSRRVIDLAVEAGCGRIVYIQPTDGTRYLDTAGQCEPNGTGWEWFQFGTMLKDKAHEVGVTVDVVKDSAARRRAKRFAASDVAVDQVETT